MKGGGGKYLDKIATKKRGTSQEANVEERGQEKKILHSSSVFFTNDVMCD